MEKIELNFRDMQEEDKVAWAEEMFRPLTNPQEIKDWVFTFLGLDMPSGHIDPDSTSSPVEAMWEIYDAIKNNKGDELPGLILLSARAAYKTLSVSMLEVLCMLHFKVTIAHMASIREQSHQSISYMNLFFTKIDPLLNAVGWEKINENKNLIEYRTPENESVYIKIIVCTPAGANCISPETILWMDEGSHILAKDVAQGQLLKTWDYMNLREEIVKVGSVNKTVKDSRCVWFDDGSNLILSKDHRIFTQDGWKCVGNLRLGDKVTGNSNEIFVTPIKERVEVVMRDPDQMILGSLLGDACIGLPPSKKTARFMVSHTKKQKEYLLLKKALLERKGFRTNIYPSRTAHSKDEQFSLYTDCNSEFLTLRTETYKPTKTVTKEWLDKLTWEGVAYWFMDDASGNASKIGSRKDVRYQISTCSFTISEHELIVEWFKERGFETWIGYVSNKSGIKYPVIQFSLDASRKLTPLISPYFVPCMAYKLVPEEKMLMAEAVDSDEFVKKVRGFNYITPKFKHFVEKTRKGRVWLNKVKSNLTSKVTKIEEVGYQHLVDIHVDTDKHYLRSFYANSLKLLHNSAHTNILCVDEIDVIGSPLAYDEAKRIPTYTKGRHPITIKLSTRKGPSGLMQRELNAAAVTGEKILRWNILDISEKCFESRHLPNEPKEDRYVAKELPLRQMSREEYDGLSSAEQIHYELVPDAYAGCKKCILLPVCKTRLAHRPSTDVGGLYRPVSAIINEFKTTPPDMAIAQLLCLRPSTRGMVYPRFDNMVDKGNVLSLEKAYETLVGEPPRNPVTEQSLLALMKSLKITFHAGVDWGYTHNFSIVIFAMIPNGEVWIIDCFSAPGLEFSDQLEIAKGLRDKYSPEKWWCDQAMPANIKGFNRNAMRAPKFTKDIFAGIEALRSKICDSVGRRLLKVLNTKNCETIVKTFTTHCFKMDAVGNPTLVPDDEPGISDEADSMRYVAQNMFPVKGTQRPNITAIEPSDGTITRQQQDFTPEQHEIMARELAKTIGGPVVKGGSGGKGGFKFTF